MDGCLAGWERIDVLDARGILRRRNEDMVSDIISCPLCGNSKIRLYKVYLDIGYEYVGSFVPSIFLAHRLRVVSEEVDVSTRMNESNESNRMKLFRDHRRFTE